MLKLTSPEDCKKILNVSRETLEKFKIYLSLLEKWQKSINLVGNSTLLDPWKRHIIDCGQVASLIKTDGSLIMDLGTGAGLPGIILSIMGKKNVHLIESDKKKVVFLHEVSRICNIKTIIIEKRVEKIPNMKAGFIIARAFAPIDKLLLTAKNQINEKTKFILLKGINAIYEIEEVNKKLKQVGFLRVRVKPTFKIIDSKTDNKAKIVICSFKKLKE